MKREKFKERVLDCADYYNLNSDYLLELVEPCYQALEWVRIVKRKTKTTPNAFRNNIEYTKRNLLELNNFIANDGYIKIIKRLDELLKHLDKYEKGELLLYSKIDNYFKVIFRKKIPTEQNIINLAKIDIEDKLYIHTMQMNYDKKTNNTSINRNYLDLEYTSDLLESIFKIKPTNHEPYYHKIIMIKNKKAILIGEYRFTNHMPFSMGNSKREIKIFEFIL